MTLPEAIRAVSEQMATLADYLAEELATIRRGQRVIMRALATTGAAIRADLHEEITAMTENLDTELTNVEGDLDAAESAEAAELADLQRELKDLVNTQNEGMLTGDQHQRLEAVRARIEALTAQSQTEAADIDAADPPPAPAVPAATDPTTAEGGTTPSSTSTEGDGTATGAAPVV